VNINLDSWQKTSKPVDYNENGGFLWTQLTGTFKNTSPGSPDHVDNCDGDQLSWLFAVPEVGFFQDYDSVDWNHSSPTHEFNQTFQPGAAYVLTIGVIGMGGGMKEGATLELSLYYRDNASNQVIVAATTVTNTSANFASTTHLVDFTVKTAIVQPGDPWANQHLGIRLLSTVSPDLQGGYWDLDNVRLSSATSVVLTGAQRTGNNFNFTIRSEPGLRFEILAAANPSAPVSQWLSIGTVTNAAGAVTFTDTNAMATARFYRARQLP
jgi:hypothetical protein